MISFITKRATVIYKVSSFFLSLVFLISSKAVWAQADINSYCFEKNVDLKSVENSVRFLLLPKDTLNSRLDDHCIDIVTSPDRGKLFEKFLTGRYNLRKGIAAPQENESEMCEIVLKATLKKTKETQTLKVGQQNTVSKSAEEMSEVQSSELVLAQGIPGELEVGAEKLKVLCHFVSPEKASLKFSFSNLDQGGVSTQVVVVKGEWLNVASIVNELNDKKKMIGIPQTNISDTNGKSETIYELKIK